LRIDYSLKTALTWRFVAVAILPLLILSGLFLGYFASEAEERFVRENRVVASSIATQISQNISEPTIVLREFSRFLNQSSVAPETYSQYLQDIAHKSADIDALFLINRDGALFAAGLPEGKVARKDFSFNDFSARQFGFDLKDIHQPVWSKTFVSELTGQPCLALVDPIGDLLLIAHINIDRISQHFEQLLANGSSHLALISRQGDLLFQIPKGENNLSEFLSRFEETFKPSLTSSPVAEYELNKTVYLGTVTKIPEVDWFVVFGQEQNDLQNAIWQLRFAFSLGILAAVSLASVWARGVAKKIIRPISELALGAKSFSAGDYRHPLPYGTHAEIDELSDSFRNMRKVIDSRERLLLNNREYFSRLFNGVADAIFVCARRWHDGLPGRFIEVNDVASQMLGQNRDELLEMTSYEVFRIALEDPDTFQLIMKDVNESGKTLFKTELLCANGEWIPVEISSQLFQLDGKDVFFSVARDITLRERYEFSIQTLVRSTVGLTGQQCLDEITQNLCLWLNADGACIGLYRKGQLEVQSFCLDDQPLEGVVLPTQQTPFEEILTGRFHHFHTDLQKQFPNIASPELTGMDSFIGIPMIGHDGNILGLVCAFSRNAMQSIPHVEELLSVISSRAVAECERMRYERELSHSEEMLRTLFNSTAEAIVGIDLAGHCVFCNPSAAKILGYATEEDLVGKSFFRLVDYRSENNPSGCPFIEEIIREKKIIQADGLLRRRDGHLVPVEFWGHPLLRDGQLSGGVITFIDISRRRTLEKQLQHSQRMEAIGTLTGGIAHDFNNILTVITGYAGLMQALYANDEDLLPKINKIAEAAERGSKLTHGLLAYSRKKTGPSNPVDLNQLVLKVQDLFGKVIGEQIEKILTLSDQQLVVLADVSQLEQVLVNLATNARDAMPDGGTLTMKTSQTIIDRDFCRSHGYGEPGEYAVITVEDTGLGIPKEIQQKIFDPFYTTKDTGKGTGLGLAIAWGIVKQHKGYILVESEPGKGSRFQILLPQTQRKLIKQLAATTSQLPDGEELILLVEDDHQVRESTCSILKAVGYQVITSDCANAALKVLDRQKAEISLILSDVVMPGMKGTDFYREIRKITDIPVIFISGYTFDSLREQGLVGEGFALLNKPIPAIDLLTRVRETIDRQLASISA